MEGGASRISPGKPIEVKVRHSVTGPGGETDIALDFVRKSDQVAMRTCFLIENKIDAPFTETQPQRYQERARRAVAATECDQAKCVLVAPNEYLESAPEADEFDDTLSYEEILAYFDKQAGASPSEQEANRCKHRCEMLKQAIDKRRRGYSPDIDEDVTAFWRQYHQLAKNVAPELRMRSPGDKPAGSTFVHFPGALEQISALPHCTIKHKLTHGFVDLELAGWSTYLEFLTPILRPSCGETMKLRKAGKSLAISIRLPEINVTRPFAQQRETVKQGLLAAKRLRAWFNEHVKDLKECVLRLDERREEARDE